MMNKLSIVGLSMIVGLAANVSFAQGTAPAPDDAAKSKGAAAAYQNPAAEKTQAEKSKSAMEAAAQSKVQPKTKSKYDEKAAMALSGSAGTDAATAAGNVEASKKMARQRPKNWKDLTAEEKAAWQKQMREQAKP